MGLIKDTVDKLRSPKGQPKQPPTEGAVVKGTGEGREMDFLDRIIQEDKPLNERIAYEFAQKLFDKKLLYMISDLNQEQRATIIRLHIINKFYYEVYADDEDIDMFQDFIDTLLQLTVSKNREGRRELVEMIIGMRGLGQLIRGQEQYGGKRSWWPRGR